MVAPVLSKVLPCEVFSDTEIFASFDELLFINLLKISQCSINPFRVVHAHPLLSFSSPVIDKDSAMVIRSFLVTISRENDPFAG